MVFLVCTLTEDGLVDAKASTCNIVSLPDFLKTPFASIEQGWEGMTCIKEYFLSNNDRRGLFTSIYVAVTEGVKEAIQKGIFNDGQWMAFYDFTFANFYRTALLNWELGNISAVPKAWSKSFDAAKNNDDILIMQHALLGVNAHINNDLAQVIAKLNITENTNMKHNDSLLVNPVIIDVYKSIMPGFIRLYTPVVNATKYLQQLDETVSYLESTLREKAWEFAFQLIASQNNTVYHALLVDELNFKSATYADVIIEANDVDPTVVKAMRKCEGVQTKTYCTLVDWAC